MILFFSLFYGFLLFTIAALLFLLLIIMWYEFKIDNKEYLEQKREEKKKRIVDNVSVYDPVIEAQKQKVFDNLAQLPDEEKKF